MNYLRLRSGITASNVPLSRDFLGPGAVLWSAANVSTWLWTGYNMLIMFSALQ